MGYITYTNDEINIVEQGIEEVRKVLMGEDCGKKRSLLFCLDWYLDPYYGNKLPYRDELVALLQLVVVKDKDQDVIWDVVDLLREYTYGPYEILEHDFEQILEAMKPLVKELIS